MKKIKLGLLVLSFNAHLAMAENFSYLIGGGGESGDKTLFDLEVDHFSYINSFSSNQKIYFDGGHALLEKNLEKTFPNAEKNHFRENDYYNFLKDLKEKIVSGKIKSGDQILVSLFSHGAQKEENVVSHKVAVKKDSQDQNINLQNLSGAEIVSLDDLKEVIKLSEDKGIKLGIIDQSCYGGATTALAKGLKNVCVLAGTNDLIPNISHDNHAVDPILQKKMGLEKSSIAAFSDALNKKGTNLEEVYLSVLTNTKSLVAPMSSIDVMKDIEAELNEVFSNKIDLLTMVTKVTNYEDVDFIGVCTEKRKFDQALISIMSQLGQGFIANSKVFQSFNQALEKYKIKLDELNKEGEKAQAVYKYMLQDPIVEITLNLDDMDGKIKTVLITKSDLINNPKQAYKMVLDSFSNDKALSRKYKSLVKTEVKKLESKRELLMKEYQTLPHSNPEKVELISMELFQSSVDLMTQMNQLKREIYLNRIQQKDSNPCRDFKI